MNHESFSQLLLTARQQARLCNAMYRGKGHVAGLAQSAPAEFRFFDTAYCRAAALIFSDHVHLSVCGTNDPHDWVSNLTAHQIGYMDGFRVHQGFAQSADLLLDGFRRSDVWTHCGSKPVILGGHSAGGAIAQLLSLTPPLHPRHLITFGAPRVFSSDTAAIYLSKSWRITGLVYGSDPVPRFPLRRFRLLFGAATYSHVTSPMLIDDAGDIHTERPSGTMAAISRAAWDAWMWSRSAGAVMFGRLPKMIRDHSMNNYLRVINERCRREGLIE